MRINREIRSANVRVINEEGEQLGVISLNEALENAEKAGMDLVEVSPNAEPPVCKIMDYGRYKYEQTKKQHEAKKKQAAFQVKEIKERRLPQLDDEFARDLGQYETMEILRADILAGLQAQAQSDSTGEISAAEGDSSRILHLLLLPYQRASISSLPAAVNNGAANPCP